MSSQLNHIIIWAFKANILLFPCEMMREINILILKLKYGVLLDYRLPGKTGHFRLSLEKRKERGKIDCHFHITISFHFNKIFSLVCFAHPIV